MEVKNINSAQECQKKCQNNGPCQSFVYVGNWSKCFLKSVKIVDAAITPREGLNLKSGPKYCGMFC